jgi:hypothetical protein
MPPTFGDYAGAIWDRLSQPFDSAAATVRGLSGAPVDPETVDGSTEILAADVLTGAEYEGGRPTNTAGAVLSNAGGRSAVRIALVVATVGAALYALHVLRGLAPLAAQVGTDLGKATITNAGGVGQLVRAVRS